MATSATSIPATVSVLAFALACALGAGPAAGGQPDDAPRAAASSGPIHGFAASDISGDPSRPRRHFRVANPKFLGPREAEAIYRRLRGRMKAGYALSGRRVYDGWRRYNRAPYLSATHGRRYVNNYANPRAAAYGRFEGAGRLPVGAIVAKDSFTVTEDGEISPGPLFLMEKMPKGFNYASGDWRYTAIMPDGSVLGVTGGENAAAVEYCIGCHLAVESQDHLYFPPPKMRVAQ